MSAPVLSPAEQRLQKGFDAWHAARASTDLVSSLYAEAMGDAHPSEVGAFSSCDWTVLGTLVGRLHMRPGQVLVDIGCGTGGVGLWLSRALAVRLVGIDISSTAVAAAATRRSHFVTPDQATFRVGTLKASGLRDGAAHGVVCVDALGFAPDRAAALREIHRILQPGARAVLTRALSRAADPAAEAAAAGFHVEHIDERPDEPAMWRRLYRLWIAHETDLRRELGELQTLSMLSEAARMLPRLAERRAIVLTLRRPAPARPADKVHPTSGAEGETG
ncbi:methyltransferase domain-containing protein [Streptomyces sp. NPDC005408]|uniref:class I SAM-dependent methyltransferase n=1 Tax=Streptomyces sp. NPDC005408 TaxID=3155341 RepID=UPI0033A1DEAA